MPLTSTQRINLGFPLALLLVAITGVVAFTSTVRLAAVSGLVDHSHHVLALSERILTNLVDAESAQRGYVITGDSAYLAPYRAARTRIAADGNQLLALVEGDAGQRRQVRALLPLAALRAQLIADRIEARRAFGFDSAAALIRDGQGREVMDSVRDLITAVQRAENQRLTVASRQVGQVTQLAEITVATGSILAFLMVLLGVLAVRHEFSVRRRAETALRENETLLKQFMDTLPIGAFVVDADGRANFANTLALAMLGRDALDRETGQDALRLWHAGAADPVPHEENPMTKALRGLAARADDLEIRMGGRPLPVEISAAPVFDSEGRVAYGIAAFADVTERKRNQAALRAAKEAAEQANEAKSDFLARMSHELRTPLNSIIGFANILIKKNAALLPDKERTYLERILDNGKHLLLLINDILDLSKIEAGKVVVEKEMVELEPLIAEVLHQWDGQLRTSSLRLAAEVPPDTAPIFTDRARLRQILINLVSNAVKFTERGTVRVIVETGEGLPRPHCIKVVDTGIGIAEDRLDAIFDAFEQAETSTARKYGGTGLGLPISRALCELLGYELAVTSRVGEGTAFTIYLDRVRATRPLEPSETAGSAPPLVLVVDDDMASRTILASQLESLGYRTVSAFSGAQALNLALALRPQLITIDLVMPDQTGWELAAKLKAEPGISEIPIVMIAVQGDEAGANVIGAIDILEKPFDGRQLSAVLQRNLSSPGGRVLIVDDDPDMRALLEKQLGQQATELRTASNGQEALAVLRDGFQPDVILLDLVMPVLDGFGVIEVLRHKGRLQRTPIIVITGKDLTPAEHEGLRSATATILTKGVGLEHDLRRALRTYLPFSAD